MVVVSFFVRGPTQVLIPKANTYAYNRAAALYNHTGPLYGNYTGFSSLTMHENTYANYTIDYTTGDQMDFATVFGVLFSSITGLLAGANMSGKRKMKFEMKDKINDITNESSRRIETTKSKYSNGFSFGSSLRFFHFRDGNSSYGCYNRSVRFCCIYLINEI